MKARFARTCTTVALGAAAVLMSGAVVAQVRSLAMLDRLDAGEWEMRLRDAPDEPRRLCLGNARRLIQLRHPGQACSRVVVEDTDEAVTVQYTCPGRGFGRTHIRRETDNLVQIDSQGIAGGQPFSFDAEARRVGACSG